jgi:hypothetical protein
VVLDSLTVERRFGSNSLVLLIAFQAIRDLVTGVELVSTSSKVILTVSARALLVHSSARAGAPTKPITVDVDYRITPPSRSATETVAPCRRPPSGQTRQPLQVLQSARKGADELGSG